MIMNKKDYDVVHKQPVEMEEPKPDCECNIECGKTLIYNNAYFFNIIKNYPDASNIIREMIYFDNEIENMIHSINKSNDVESLYVQRNILIESFSRFIVSRVYDFIDKIFNEAINRNKPEKEKTFYEYNLPKELIGMLSNLSFSGQFFNGFEINAELFAETVRIDMINFYLMQNPTSNIIQVDSMFNEITKNLLFNVINFHNGVASSYIHMMNHTELPGNQSCMVCEPSQTLISQPYYSEMNRNLRNYDTESLFKFSKTIDADIKE